MNDANGVDEQTRFVATIILPVAPFVIVIAAVVPDCAPNVAAVPPTVADIKLVSPVPVNVITSPVYPLLAESEVIVGGVGQLKASSLPIAMVYDAGVNVAGKKLDVDVNVNGLVPA